MPLFPTATVYEEPEDVTAQLSRLDLTPAVFERALWKAYGEHLMVTDHDPAWLAGSILPGKATRFLRDVLAPRGWTPITDDGVELVLHPTGRLAIVVWSGDPATADPSYEPSTRRPRGEASRVIVNTNQQLVLFGEASTTARPTDRPTWALLVRASASGVLAELSLPLDMTRTGEITGWSERIILGHIDGGNQPIADVEPGAPRKPFSVEPLAS